MSLADRHRRVTELFAEACELPDEARLAFLNERCGDDHELRREVLELLERDADPDGPLPPSDAPPDDSHPTTQLLHRLASHQPTQSRYRLEGEIARGGMGAILKVWDADLQRHLAMKVILGRGEADSTGRTPPVDERTLGRFLGEAQITGQLDHPGIVPVHELGLDETGRVFFTMRLVKGRDLRAILELARTGAEGWSTTRVLGVLLRVCEAMAFAHAKGVVHRDLKPGNVMVGRFGEVYVMDWGLGRVVGDEPRPAGDDAEARRLEVSDVRTYREGDDASPEAPLQTLEGDVVGTPVYMSPEQARGDLKSIGPPTDVYAVGAMIYETLVERQPYIRQGERVSPRTIWGMVLAGPPRAIEELAPRTPPELVAICNKAMARRIEDRYADVGELGDDLRAYLENRVVRAHRTGPLAELRKWIERNRLTAAVLAALLLVTSGGGFWLARTERLRSEETQRRIDGYRAAELVDMAETLWPVDPASTEALVAWLAEARELVAQRPELEAALAAAGRPTHDPVSRSDDELDGIEARLDGIRSLLADERDGVPDESGLPPIPADDLELLDREVVYLTEEVAAARVRHRQRPSPRSPKTPQASELTELVADLTALAEPSLGWIAAVQRRLERADLAAGHAQAWDEAIAWVSAASSGPYGGLELVPQPGLVPLGADSGSGLWEFWHVASGSAPQRGDDGWILDDDTGLVLVLLPGGDFLLGAQDEDPAAPGYVDLSRHPEIADIRPSEGPPRRVRLDPFFLSKYELTQGQWFRLTTRTPSRHWSGSEYRGEERISRVHPVERVDWEESVAALAGWGLTLPTEVQWEYAARSGTDRLYASDDGTFAGLVGRVNFADVSSRRRNVDDPHPTIDDGWGIHGPVNAFGPGPFGLFGMAGNVREWCLDDYGRDYADLQEILPGTGRMRPTFTQGKVTRGGSFVDGAGDLRTTIRAEHDPRIRFEYLGARPCRPVDD